MGELSSIGSAVHSGPSLCARASNRSVHLVGVRVGVTVRVRVRVGVKVGVRVGVSSAAGAARHALQRGLDRDCGPAQGAQRVEEQRHLRVQEALL